MPNDTRLLPEADENIELRERLLRDLRGGAEGLQRWSSRPAEERQAAGDFSGADLAGAALAGVDLGGLDFHGANFDGAAMSKAWLLECNLAGASLQGTRLEQAWCVGANLQGASLRGAVLVRANLRGCDCRQANFQGANLEGATLTAADLCGADLLSANLKGATLLQARYDGQTRWPRGFEAREAMEWVGQGTPPLDFDVFMSRLAGHVDQKRLGRALEMLKAERFHLYSEIGPEALTGVVKSQTVEDVVYACRLASDGSFTCCSQNLQLCLGLRSALCKHLLVLIVGLTRSGQVEAALVERWVKASKRQGPALDQDAMADALLRYKGAEAGEIDWRPTETIPEDYYTL
jgi:hypothetical protein